MARHAIEKDGLDADGKRILVAWIMDANGEWNESVFQRVPDEESDARIEQLLADGRFEVWPIAKPQERPD